MHRLTSCSVTLKKWVTNFELSRPSRNFPIEVGSEMAFFWLIWPRELPKIWKKDLWWPLAFHSCKKEGCNWFQITNPSEYTSQNTSRKWDFFWSLMPLVSMCIFRERFEEAEQMFFSPAVWSSYNLAHQMGAFRRPAPMCNLQGLEFEATYLGCSVRRLWRDQENRRQGHSSESVGRSGEICSADPHISKVSCFWIKLFGTCKQAIFTIRRIIEKNDSSHREATMVEQMRWIRHLNTKSLHDIERKMILVELRSPMNRPRKGGFFCFYIYMQNDRCIIFFFLKFSTKPFCVRFHMSFEGFWSGLWRGWCDCSFKRPKKFVSGVGDRTWVITYICIFFLSLIKLDCIYMYLLFVSDEFFFHHCFLAVHKNAIRLGKKLLLSNLFQFARTFALTQQNKGK